MERRKFLESCVAVSGTLGLSALPAWADATPRLYDRARLVDIHGAPLKARALVAETNYIFHYPFVSTPCFLLNLGRPAMAEATLRREDGTTYAWNGGVGPGARSLLFRRSARTSSRTRRATCRSSAISRSRSATSDAHVIHCCADHSVYDPASGARVLAGPAPQPLAAILLDHDPATDELSALGTVGAEQFDAFFRKYEFKLALDHGQASAQKRVGKSAVVRELAQYCKQTIQC